MRAPGRPSSGIDNVEFRQLELEWIDLETASVDAVLVRWGIMLTVDPPAAAREIRRVLRPGGHAALAVWAARERNPWALIPGQALLELGYAEPPDPIVPGPFALAEDGRLAEVLEDAGFTDVEVAPVSLERHYAGAQEIVAESANCSPSFSVTYNGLSEEQQGRGGGPHDRRGRPLHRGRRLGDAARGVPGGPRRRLTPDRSPHPAGQAFVQPVTPAIA